MKTIHSTPERAAQDVIQQLDQIPLLLQPLMYYAIQTILDQLYGKVGRSIVTEIVNAVFSKNAILKHPPTGGTLLTAFTKVSYRARELPFVKLVEFVMGKEKQ